MAGSVGAPCRTLRLKQRALIVCSRAKQHIFFKSSDIVVLGSGSGDGDSSNRQKWEPWCCHLIECGSQMIDHGNQHACGARRLPPCAAARARPLFSARPPPLFSARPPPFFSPSPACVRACVRARRVCMRACVHACVVARACQHVHHARCRTCAQTCMLV